MFVSSWQKRRRLPGADKRPGDDHDGDDDHHHIHDHHDKQGTLRINDCYQKSESMARPKSKLQVPRLSGLGHLALPTLQNAYRLGKKKNSKKWSKSGICNILPHQFFYLQRSGYGEGPALK